MKFITVIRIFLNNSNLYQFLLSIIPLKKYLISFYDLYKIFTRAFTWEFFVQVELNGSCFFKKISAKIIML